MKAFWKKFGIWIEAALLFVTIVMMIVFRFWEADQGKGSLKWPHFIFFMFYFLDRVVKIWNRYRKQQTVMNRINSDA